MDREKLIKQLFVGKVAEIVIDDPIKPDDANSDAIRESMNTKFDTIIRNRVNSRNTHIVSFRISKTDLIPSENMKRCR